MASPRTSKQRPRPQESAPSGLGLIPRFVLLIGGLLGGLQILLGVWLTSGLDERFERSILQTARRAVAVSYGVEDREVDQVRVQGGYEFKAAISRNGATPVPVFIHDEFAESPAAGLSAGIWAAFLSLSVLALVVAWFAAVRVTKPLGDLTEDVTEISRGHLTHRIRVQAGGEIASLARAVGRMVDELARAEDTEEALQRREHDALVASEIRTNLVPDALPTFPGWELAGTDLAAEEVSGDYFDVIEPGEGCVGLLVSEIAGSGVPAALVMSMARAYLRAEAMREASPAEAFARANRMIHADLRRGMYVTALYAVLDVTTGLVKVANAGHKVPLLVYRAAEKKLAMVHSEGIALGLDKGPVFERTMREVEVQLEPGDRIVLATTGITAVKNPDDEALGDKAFYKLCMRHGARETSAFLEDLLTSVAEFAEDVPIPKNIVLMSSRRVS